MGKPTVFISYSHKDEDWKDRLRPHLGVLEKAGRITLWDDRRIDAGDDLVSRRSRRPWRMRRSRSA